MSAFIVSNESLTNLRNYIAFMRIENMSEDSGTAVKNASKIVNAWAKMNRYAILCRYGDTTPAAVLGRFADPISKFQFFKSLCCLQYQCSESDTDKVHRKAWKELGDHIKAVAVGIAHDHPEVQKAEWA